MEAQSTAQRVADGLLEQAREHKREAERSREKMRRAFATLEEHEAFCRANQIPIVRKGRDA